MRSAVLFLLTGCVGLSSYGEKAVTDSSATDGTDVVSAGAFNASPGSIDFGTLALGGVASEDVLVTNTSSGLVRLVAELSGDDAFSLTETSLAVAPDEQTVITVSFSPEDTLYFEGTLGLADADGNSLEIPLLGAGEGADTQPTDTDTDPTEPGEGNINASPTSHDFGEVDTGASSSKAFTISNDGDADLLVSNLRLADPAFTVTASTFSLPQVLRPGESKSATVSFSPVAVRSYSTTLTVESDDPAGNTVIALQGEGADLCDICSGLIDVDTGGDPYTMDTFVSILGLPSSATAVITNVGDMDLSVSDVYVNNDTLATCGSFRISGWTGARTLSPGATTRFEVSYTATSVCVEVPLASLDQNVVHILSDDPSQPDYVIELSAIGLN